MNFTNIRYFLSIVDEGGISAAARTLYISQQSLSEQLKKLEAEVGTPLLHRKNPIALTVAGECFYEGGKKLVSLYDELMADIEDITQKRRSKLTIGVPTFHIPPYFPDFLVRFQERHPEYEIAIVKRWHNDISRNMSGVDIYLSYWPLSPELENHILQEDDAYCVTFQRRLAEAVYGSRWEDVEQQLLCTQDLSLLKEMPFIILRDRYGHVTQDLSRIFEEHGFTPIPGFNSENFELNSQICYNGKGCLLAAESYVEGIYFRNKNLDTQELLSYPIRVTSFETKVAVSYEKGKHLHAAERCFLRELDEFFQKSQLCRNSHFPVP